MKEFDYTKWDNKPREMWVWDNDKSRKVKYLVLFINIDEKDVAHVLALDNITIFTKWFKHCAEIKQTRRMTNYELAHWLWEGTQKGEFRELIYVGDEVFVYTIINYNADDTNKPVSENIKIRVNGGEWKEPLIEE